MTKCSLLFWQELVGERGKKKKKILIHQTYTEEKQCHIVYVGFYY